MAGAVDAVRAVAIVVPWLAHLFVADLLLSLLLPVSVAFPTGVYDVSSKIAASVWYGVQLIFTRVNGAHITISGDSLPPGESAVVIANHVSWTDFYMIQQLAINSGMLGRSRYFAKQSLKWVPFLGWGLWALGMPLVSRRWLQDQAEMKRVFSGIVSKHWPVWLISYSEGTRFSRRKYQETLEWCATQQKPEPKHTLYPRTKGFVATVTQLRKASQVKAVYDITIAYSKGDKFMQAPSMWETLSDSSIGAKYSFHADVRRYPLDELPADEAKLAQWLEDRWIEKGQTLELVKKAVDAKQPLSTYL